MVPHVVVIPIQKILARYSQNNLRTSYDHYLDKNANHERDLGLFSQQFIFFITIYGLKCD
jgi:hypothetical protein